MKLDATCFRYLTKEHFRVLEAIEIGMKNHELVPVTLITYLAKLRHGGIQKLISHLIYNKLIAHDGKNTYDGFRLTYSGYDFLALHYFINKKIIIGLGRQIGIGKESDIFIATQEDGTEIAIKFHRLGRTSFRAIRKKRDYVSQKDKSTSHNWFFLSHLSAKKEYLFLQALDKYNFPVPKPLEFSRHAICMELIDGLPLYTIRKTNFAKRIYEDSMNILIRLAEHGLVHCDFNEFNLLLTNENKVILIDFPQMISTSHPNAEELFNRDVAGVVKFFSRLQHGAYTPDELPKFSEIIYCKEKLEIDSTVKPTGIQYHEPEENDENEDKKSVISVDDNKYLEEEYNELKNVEYDTNKLDSSFVNNENRNYSNTDNESDNDKVNDNDSDYNNDHDNDNRNKNNSTTKNNKTKRKKNLNQYVNNNKVIREKLKKENNNYNGINKLSRNFSKISIKGKLCHKSSEIID